MGHNQVGIAAPASPAVIKKVEEAYSGFWQKMSKTLDIDYHGVWDIG